MKILLFLVSVSAFGQTKVTLGQIQFSGFTPGCILMVTSPTTISCVLWKSGVVAVADPMVEFGWRLPDTPDPATLIVARNGAIQDVGDDYRIDGNLIVFTQAQTSNPGDKIKCYYFVKQP